MMNLKESLILRKHISIQQRGCKQRFELGTRCGSTPPATELETGWAVPSGGDTGWETTSSGLRTSTCGSRYFRFLWRAGSAQQSDQV